MYLSGKRVTFIYASIEREAAAGQSLCVRSSRTNSGETIMGAKRKLLYGASNGTLANDSASLLIAVVDLADRVF